MTEDISGAEGNDEVRLIATRWCALRGAGWSCANLLGTGGTAKVFEVRSPDGPLALKLYDLKYSSNEKGEIEEKRIEQQVELGAHNCPSLIKVIEGGRFEDRLFVLMSRPPGRELEGCLGEVPRDCIRGIVDQIACAVLFLRERSLCHRDIKPANIVVSDDFKTATLLDLSVTRNITDPAGLGTDHGDSLPVVATARYAPPEYLFRLIEPDAQLWNALDVYQLGALLHDLIMRKQLFQDDYEASKENRYRFAWIVATVIPKVQAVDVDGDLVFLAQRALAKDWRARIELSVHDFLATDSAGQAAALALFGFSQQPAAALTTVRNPSSSLQWLREVARAVESALAEALRERGVTCRHRIALNTARTEHTLIYDHWQLRSTRDRKLTDPELRLVLSVEPGISNPPLHTKLRLVAELEGRAGEATLTLPSTPNEPGIEKRVVEYAMAALPKLTVEVIKTCSMPSEA